MPELPIPPHKHWFHLLYAHFGPFGNHDQDHYHPCVWEDANRDMPCKRVLIATGRDCGGRKQPHVRYTLTVNGPKRRAKAEDDLLPWEIVTQPELGRAAQDAKKPKTSGARRR